MIKIGATETYEPCYCIKDWKDNSNFDYVLLITKNLSNELIELLTNPDSNWYYAKKPSIVHITCTGWSGTIIEPNSPSVKELKDRVLKLIELGFPVDRLVLRIDPIIPIKEGIERFYRVTTDFMDTGIHRCRISVLDLYYHVSERLIEADDDLCNEILTLYNDRFTAPMSVFRLLNNLINESHLADTYRFESCAETKFNPEIVQRLGCVSKYDLELNGINDETAVVSTQRANCLCLAKKQLIPGGMSRGRCPNKCIYCYIKDR